MSFNFGPTTTSFSANRTPTCQALVDQLAEAKLALNAARSKTIHLESELASVKYRADILWGCFNWTRTKLLTMDDEEEQYNHLVVLQSEKDQLEEKVQSLTEKNLSLIQDGEDKDKELHLKNEHIDKQAADIKALREAREHERSAFEEQDQIRKEVEKLLSNAYAETTAVKKERDTAREQRDNARASQYDTELKLDSLRDELAETQEQLQDLESTKTVHKDQANMILDLTKDIAELAAKHGDKDHQIKVQDLRIAHLENQLQKALTAQSIAIASAEAARSPTAEPIIPSGESLASELMDLGDEEFEETEPEDHNEFVGVLEHSMLETIPIEPRRAQLSFAEITSIDTEPIEAPGEDLSFFDPSTTIDISPTEVARPLPTISKPTAQLNISNIASTQTAPISPQPATGVSTSTQTSPIKTKRPAQPISPEQKVLGDSTTTAISTSPKEPSPKTKIEYIQIPARHPQKSLWYNSVLWFYTATLLGLLCLYLWRRLQAWEYANTSHYHRDVGAYGTGTYFLYFIPLGWSYIGNSAFLESFARTGAKAIQMVDSWGGVNHAFVY